MSGIHQKPPRLRYAPGQKWTSADGEETALVTNVESRTQQGEPDQIFIRFVWSHDDGSSSVVTSDEAEFRERFPMFAD